MKGGATNMFYLAELGNSIIRLLEGPRFGGNFMMHDKLAEASIAYKRKRGLCQTSSQTSLMTANRLPT